MASEDSALRVLPCAVLHISLRPASSSGGARGAGGAVSKWELKRALKLALASLPAASVAHEEYSLASSGGGLVQWRIASESGDVHASKREAASIAGLLRGKILRVAAKGAVASIAVSDVRVSTAESATADENAGRRSSTVKVERVPAAWVAVSSDGLAEKGAPAHSFAARFGSVRVCECVLRQSADVLLPLEADICVRYSDDEEARRAVQLLSHCVVKKEGSSMVYGPTARFVDDRLLSDEALAERAKQRQAEQKRLMKLQHERQRCEEELEENSAALHRWMEETTAARDTLRDQPVVRDFDEAVKEFLHRSSQLQQLLQTDASRDRLKGIRHQMKDAMREVEHHTKRLRDEYQQHQDELERQERAMMTEQMRETGRRFLADLDEYTARRQRVFADAQQLLTSEGKTRQQGPLSQIFQAVDATVLEAVRHAEALIRGYTSLGQICKSLMDKETVFTDKYLQGIGDYLGRCMQAYRQAKPRVDLVESLVQSHRRNCAVATEVAVENIEESSSAHKLLRGCLNFFRACCDAATSICQAEVYAEDDDDSLDAIRVQSEFAGEALEFVLAMQHAAELLAVLDSLCTVVEQRLLALPRRDRGEVPREGHGELRLLSGGRITLLQYLDQKNVQVVASEICMPRRLSGGFGVEAANVCKDRRTELEAAAEAMSTKVSSLPAGFAADISAVDALHDELASLRKGAEQLLATIERAHRTAEANLMQLEDELSAYRQQIEAQARMAEAQQIARERREMGVEDKRATALRRVEQLQEKKRNLERQAELERKRLRPETKEYEHEGILLLRPAWELVEPTHEIEHQPTDSLQAQARPSESKADEREAALREKLLAQALRKKFAASKE